MILFFAFVFFSNNLRIRYILPIVQPLVILSVYGAKNIIYRAKGIKSLKTQKFFRVIIYGVIVIAFLLNTNYIYAQFKIVKPFEYLSGKITRDQYIERYRHEYPAMQYINRNLPEDAKVMFFYIGHRGYYCDREYIFDMIHYKSTLLQIVKKVDNPEAAYRILQQKGITHFLIRNDIFNRWVSEDFSDKEKDFLKRFFREYVEPLYIKHGYGVFRLSVLGKGSPAGKGGNL